MENNTTCGGWPMNMPYIVKEKIGGYTVRVMNGANTASLVLAWKNSRAEAKAFLCVAGR